MPEWLRSCNRELTSVVLSVLANPHTHPLDLDLSALGSHGKVGPKGGVTLAYMFRELQHIHDREAESGVEGGAKYGGAGDAAATSVAKIMRTDKFKFTLSQAGDIAATSIAKIMRTDNTNSNLNSNPPSPRVVMLLPPQLPRS
eukprot:gene31060-7154_t